MSIKEIDVSVGSESQVAVAISLTTTTDEARDRFRPLDRGCYFEGELSLKYLPGSYYRYSIQFDFYHLFQVHSSSKELKKLF